MAQNPQNTAFFSQAGDRVPRRTASVSTYSPGRATNVTESCVTVPGRRYVAHARPVRVRSNSGQSSHDPPVIERVTRQFPHPTAYPRARVVRGETDLPNDQGVHCCDKRGARYGCIEDPWSICHNANRRRENRLS
jgi:hypothetical protein